MALKLNVKPAAKANKTKYNGPAGADKLATVFRDAVREKDEVEARLKMAREDLLEIVNEHRESALRSGVAENTVTLPTSDGGKVLVIYTERFKGLSDDNGPALRESFGAKYDLYVEHSESVALAKTATLTALRAAAGDRFDAIMALLDVSSTLTPRKGAYEQIAAAYRTGEVQLAEDLEMFVNACSITPTVRT